MSYSPQKIRNICLLGHSGTGKTSLVESFLYMTGASDRMGKPSDGNTVCDYDQEEIKRQISISAAIVPIEYNGYKINVLDTPGNFDFSGEVAECLSAADACVIVCAAKGGLSVGTERAWKYAEEQKIPRIVYISKMDEDNVDYDSVFRTLCDYFGKTVAPLTVPVWDKNRNISGIIDVVNKRAYEIQKGKQTETAVPDDMVSSMEDAYGQLMESVAETSEELMEKFFAEEPFTHDEIIQGLKCSVADCSLIPVVCGSAVTCIGTLSLLNEIVDLLPSPAEAAPIRAEDENEEPMDFVMSSDHSPAAFVFKTIADQYGKYSLVKVIAGSLSPDMTLVNATTGQNEKVGRLYLMKGKKSEEIKELTFGDIGAIAKMDKLKTGDTLYDSHQFVKVAPIPFAEPNYSKAISPKVRGQDDKVSTGLSRLNEEDPTFTVVNNSETHQVVLTTSGDIATDVLVSKLKNRFGVEVDLTETRVAYREKIRKTVSKQGRHKKQTGGAGQFGDVWIRFEPNPEIEEPVFAEEVFGGAVPKNFFPAVEKGIKEACLHGVLAGYPVVNLKAVLYDGSYHPVDSNEIAFKTAAQIAYRAALPEANPVLLEPVGELKVTIPDNYMGDVIGDLNKRRGRVMGMDPQGDGTQIISAEVPIAEMNTYSIDLRAMTQSRGMFTFHFIRYEECPPAAQEKAIAAAKALAEE